MLLFIDTSDYEEATIALVEKQVVRHHFKAHNLSEILLPEIKKFLKKQKIQFDQLQKIAVVVGPGGFSRIRTAVSTSNALAFARKIPIAAITKNNLPADLKKLTLVKSQQMVKPIYDREPNITLAKKP